MCEIRLATRSQRLRGSIPTIVHESSESATLPWPELTRVADESWTELLGALFLASQSTDPDQREAAFRIFATTPGIIEKQHEGTVQEVFAKGFKDENVAVWSPILGSKHGFTEVHHR